MMIKAASSSLNLPVSERNLQDLRRSLFSSPNLNVSFILMPRDSLKSVNLSSGMLASLVFSLKESSERSIFTALSTVLGRLDVDKLWLLVVKNGSDIEKSIISRCKTVSRTSPAALYIFGSLLSLGPAMFNTHFFLAVSLVNSEPPVSLPCDIISVPSESITFFLVLFE